MCELTLHAAGLAETSAQAIAAADRVLAALDAQQRDSRERLAAFHRAADRMDAAIDTALAGLRGAS